MAKARPGSTASGTTLHFAASDSPSAIPASASVRWPCAGRRTARAHSHSDTIANASIAGSSIAIRAITNSRKLVPSNSPAISVAGRERLAHQVARSAANSANAPASADGSRHANELSPSSHIDAAISSLPSNGCSGFLTSDSASRLRAAGR